MINVDTDGRVQLVTHSEVSKSACWYKVWLKGDVMDELEQLAAAYSTSIPELIECLVKEAKEHG